LTVFLSVPCFLAPPLPVPVSGARFLMFDKNDNKSKKKNHNKHKKKKRKKEEEEEEAS
jgi:hypothetical protein